MFQDQYLTVIGHWNSQCLCLNSSFVCMAEQCFYCCSHVGLFFIQVCSILSTLLVLPPQDLGFILTVLLIMSTSLVDPCWQQLTESCCTHQWTGWSLATVQNAPSQVTCADSAEKHSFKSVTEGVILVYVPQWNICDRNICNKLKIWLSLIF